MKCLVCGKDLPENSKFCDSCGSRVMESTGENSSVANTPIVDNMGVNSNELNQTISNPSADTISDTTASIDDNLENISIDNNILNADVIDANINGGDSSNTNLDNATVNENNISEINISPISSISSPNLEQNNVSNEVKKAKKSKLPFIIIILVLLVAIGSAIAILLLRNKKAKPEEVFINGVKELTSKLFVSDNSSLNYNSITSKFDLKTNISATDGDLNSIFDVTNKIALSGNMSVDYQNKIINGDVKFTYDNQELTDVTVYGESNNLYLYLSGLYDKYIKMPINNYDSFFKSSKEDLKVLKNSIDSAFESAVKKVRLSQKMETVNINGHNKKVTSNILTIDNKNKKEFNKAFSSTLANNSKFVELLSKMSGTDKVTLKNYLNSSETTQFANNESLIITIYTDSQNNFVGVKLDTLQSSDVNSVTVYKLDDNNYNFVVSDGKETINGSLNIENKDSVKTYKITSDSNEYKIEITFSNKETYNENVKKLDVTNNVSYELLTEEDMKKIQNNFMNNNAFMSLVTDIYGLMGFNSFDMSDSTSSLDTDFDLDTNFDL